MTTSKHRRENAWKVRKQSQQPHGKIASLRDLAAGRTERV
ncbi:DUF6254 family protein [Cohnella thailandensis]|jgi:hypothetical protein|nr:DUF6254 family protein [Cohnella thailandensis]MBP1973125.1 hypothetical protein [Cohnella thailandensis]